MTENKKGKELVQKEAPSKESIHREILEMTKELDIVMNLKKALFRYIQIYDIDIDELENTIYLLIGKLEVSALERKEVIYFEQEKLRNL